MVRVLMSRVAGGNTTLTAGSVAFSDGSVLTEDNANFFWDDTNNRLGIGTTTPTDAVDIASTLGEMYRATNYANNTVGAATRLRKARGTVAAPRRAKSGDTLGGVNAFGALAADDSTDATFSTSSGLFRFIAAEDFTSTARGTKFILSITPTGTTSAAQGFEVNGDGNIGIPNATSTSKLNITGLPTSSAGLATGDVWSNSGVLTIV